VSDATSGPDADPERERGPGPDAPDGPGSGTGDDRPERPGTAALLAAPGVARHAKVGFAVGAVLALALLAMVLGSPEAAQYPVFLYVALAFVLAVGVGLLLTVVFTVGVAIRRARGMDADNADDPATERPD
jgi:hypothetical protein